MNNHQKIASIFDYTIKDEMIPVIPEDLLKIYDHPFKLGYIVGDSGTGKTSIFHQLSTTFGFEFLLPMKSVETLIVDYFDNENEAINRLTMAGLSSIPLWFRSYNHLSKGEQFRVDLALSLRSSMIVDEFTSNLDRLTARSLSGCIRKYVHRNGLTQITLGGCQYDVIKWLEPDFVYDLNINAFLEVKYDLKPWITQVTPSNESSLLSYPIDEKTLVLRPAPLTRWKIYSKHHYLDSSLLSNAKCFEAFILVDGFERGIGFIAVSPLPSGTIRYGVREHRLVVIPSAQGVGLGITISETIARYYQVQGFHYYTKTSHPRLGEYRNKSPLWRNTSKNQKLSTTQDHKEALWKSTDRMCYSHEFIDDGSFIEISKCPIDIPLDEIVSKYNPSLKWRPLKIYGEILVSGSGDISSRINHKISHHYLKDYVSSDKARSAAAFELEVESKRKSNNLYAIIDRLICVDLTPDFNGSVMLIIDIDQLDKIKDHIWRHRLKRVYTTISKVRLYIEEALFPKQSISQHHDGNHFNYSRENLVITPT